MDGIQRTDGAEVERPEARVRGATPRPARAGGVAPLLELEPTETGAEDAQGRFSPADRPFSAEPRRLV